MDFSTGVELIVESFLRGVYTSIPAVVTKVVTEGNSVLINARPLIGRRYDDGDVSTPPEITNIPVVFPSAGGGMLSFPITGGDGVLIVFSMRDIDNWSSSDGVNNREPTSSRHHSITDAIAIPGLYTTQSNLSPSTTDVELKFANSFVRMKPNGDVDVSASGNISLTSAQDVNITAVGDVNISGTNINLN